MILILWEEDSVLVIFSSFYYFFKHFYLEGNIEWKEKRESNYDLFVWKKKKNLWASNVGMYAISHGSSDLCLWVL